MTGWVYVKGPDGEAVYVNGNHEAPAGPANAWFAVEFGLNVFEALDDAGKVRLSADTTVTAQRPLAEVELGPAAAGDVTS